jgi:orotate phosphoribosyltransferase
MHPEGALLIARLLLERIAGDTLDAAGGPTLGADPIVGAMAAVSALGGRPLPAFIVRGETKAHGTQQRIEGQLARGWRVAVLDDVVTGGGSIGKAVAAVRDAGAEVVRLLTVVDRRPEASATLDGVPFTALFTIGEVLDADAR